MWKCYSTPQETNLIHLSWTTNIVRYSPRTHIKNLNPDKAATLVAYCYERLKTLKHELQTIQAEAILHREECLTLLAQEHPHNATAIETIKEREKLQKLRI